MASAVPQGSAAAALMRAEELLRSLGGGPERLDERSRNIVLHIAHAQATGELLHPSTLHRHGRFGSVVTVRTCVKRLIGGGLLKLVPNPANKRQRFLAVEDTVLAAIDAIAREFARLGPAAPSDEGRGEIDLTTR